MAFFAIPDGIGHSFAVRSFLQSYILVALALVACHYIALVHLAEIW